MNIETLTTFFLWCTLINFALLLLWAIAWKAVPDLVYRIQNAWFPMPRETFNVVFYCFIGFYKILVLVFNFIPLIVLLIIG